MRKRRKEPELRDERERERRVFFMKGRGKMKQNGMDLMNGWLLCVNVYWIVYELASNKTGGVQEKVRSSK